MPSYKTPRFLNHIAWSTLGTLVSAFIRLAVLLALARLIEVSDFGLYSVAVILTGLIGILIDLGLSAAYIQNDASRRRISIGDITLIHGAWALLLIFGIYQLKPWLEQATNAHFTQLLFTFMSISIIAKSLGASSEAHLQKINRFKLLNMIEMLSYTLSYGLLAVGLALLDYGVVSLFLAMALQAILKSVSCIYFCVKDIKELKDQEKHSPLSLLRYGFGMTLGQFVNYLTNQGDQLLISKLIGVQAVGSYGRAFQLSIMPINLLGQAVDKVLFPEMSKVLHTQDSLFPHYLKALSFIFLLSVPLVALLYFIGEPLTLFLLGEQWLEAASIFPILALAMVPRLTNKLSDTFARAMGAMYSRFALQCLFLFNMIVAVLYSYEQGLIKVVFYLLLASLLNSFIFILFITKKTQGQLLNLVSLLFEIACLCAPLLLILKVLNIYLLENLQPFFYLVTMTLSYACLMLLLYNIVRKIEPNTVFFSGLGTSLKAGAN